MKKIGLAAAGATALILLAPAARAQLVPNGQNGPAVTPQAPTPDFAPPALPGAGATPGIAGAPKVKKVDQGDPTTQLFTAINNNDYNSAQDAISRGADLNAQNALGETPLDMSIALNQNSITFLLLGARNEGAGGPPPPSQQAAAPPPPKYHVHTMPASIVSAPPQPAPAPAPSPPAQNATAAPNPSAGFLGFGPKT